MTLLRRTITEIRTQITVIGDCVGREALRVQ